jgi:hypothetical protein
MNGGVSLAVWMSGVTRETTVCAATTTHTATCSLSYTRPPAST